MAESVFARLCQVLDDAEVRYEVTRHEAVYTSEEAAAVRGAQLASGAKALVCKANGEFLMFVVPADRRLDSKRLRKQHGMRGLRFANREEVFELTGLQPGAIPPFGCLFALPTWCDVGLADNSSINFNAGDHCLSVQLAFEDYRRLEKPQMAEFTE